VLGCFASPDDFPLTDAEGVSKDAVISNGAVLAASASVGSGSRIGENSVLSAGVRVGREVRIGSGCRFYPNVVIHDGSVIGDRVTVKSNSVIGGCGFGYHRVADRHIPIPQIGNVVIGDDVDIGSCVCVDRGTIGSTRIGRNVKIDNLVQIAHNVVIGENAIVISQVGISGSVTVGKDAILAGQAGIADHIVIEDGAIVGAKAGVLGRVKTGEMVLGIPARPIMAFKRSVIYMEKLGDLFKRVAAIEKKSQEEPHG
jgi:UDP-3-O-[3-hydroxymyristoyl] glucosamine N-acyltransferase